METGETTGAQTEGKEGGDYFRCVKCIQASPAPGSELVPRDEICSEGKLSHLVEEFESHSDLQGKTQL